ncbi:hypothetical protein Dimus_001900 [Dionaea muscipula]
MNPTSLRLPHFTFSLVSIRPPLLCPSQVSDISHPSMDVGGSCISTRNVVQHISRASSDQLLQKFADTGGPDLNKSRRASTKRTLAVVLKRRLQRSGDYVSDHRTLPGDLDAIGDRRLLLPPVTGRSGMLRPIRSRIRSSRLRDRDHRDDVMHKSVIGTIKKTWRKAVGDATRMFIEKNYNRHRRLNNDTTTTTTTIL